MNQISVFYFFNIKIKIMELDQEELQKQSEILKEQKIKQIKDDIRTNCLKVLNLPEEIKNIILDYSFDESTIETNNSLKAKVKEYCNIDKEYLISELDVSCVTSMNHLFSRCNDFNQSLDKWDTSNVVDMCAMFIGCHMFNRPVNFNTSNVLYMEGMFCHCEKFNQPVNFDTKNVINMESMFCWCCMFNQSLEFNTSNVINMIGMFWCCYSFNQPVDFDTKNVINMEDMFYGCENLEEKNKKLVMH